MEKRGHNLTTEIRQRAAASTAKSMTDEEKKARNIKGAKVLARSMTKEQRIARAKKANEGRQRSLARRAAENVNNQ